MTGQQRRRFLTLVGGALLVLPAAAAERRSSDTVVGFLHGESPALFGRFLEIFHESLKEAGFVEGDNVAVEYRWGEGHNDRLPALAADLVQRRVDVIAAPGSTPAALAAKKATSSIPIVIFTAGDPVALGLVARLNRPGGNVTGATSLGRDLVPKRLELLHELIPQATTMALLVNPTNPSIAESTAKTAHEAARVLGLRLCILRAGTERDFESAFASLRECGASGLVVAVDSFFTARREKLAELALRHRVPAIYQYADFVRAGGIMSYGGNFDGYRIAGLYTGRILKGESPADLPVQQTTRTELVVGMESARALGLELPPGLAARTDEVID